MSDHTTDMDEVWTELMQEAKGFRLRAENCRKLLPVGSGHGGPGSRPREPAAIAAIVAHQATRLNGKAAAYDHCAELLEATIRRMRANEAAPVREVSDE